MVLRLSRSTLMLASALAMTGTCAGMARAQDSAGQLGSIEKQIQSLQAELRHMKAELAARNREQRTQGLATSHTPPAVQSMPVMPQIPAGYALVPASPGSAPGSVVLVRAEPPPPKLPMGTFRVGAVDVQLGGYIDASTIYRSRNEVTDLASNFASAIPLRYSPLYHESEFRETARATRMSVTATAHPDDETVLKAFVATDFQGAGPSSNSVQTNSYTLRLREGFATYDRKDWGFQVLGGQTFSLLTMNQTGIDPFRPNLPLTIDMNYLPGFNYTRQPQIRFTKSFADNQFWLAASFENPQASFTNTSIPSTLGTLNVNNPGTGSLANGSNTAVNACTAVTTTTTTTTVAGKSTSTSTSTCTTSAATATGNFSDDIAPDVVVKAAADFNMLHLEAVGLGRVFHDRLSQLGTGQSNTAIGGGAGGGAILHVIPKKLDLQVSGLAGEGIGRYGTSQLPDSTINAAGKPELLPEWNALVGLIAHPTPIIDLYGYVGTEQISARYYDTDIKGKVTAYGYGNPLYNNEGCEIELSPASTCVANTKGTVGGTVGGYYKFAKGPFGTMQVGAQYAYTHRSIFQGEGRTPSTDENTVMLSFRYYPFQ
jgi:hypothetical protein